VPDAASFCINDPLSKVSIGRSTFLFQLRLGLSRFKLLLSNGYSSIVDHGTSSIVVKFLSLSLPLLPLSPLFSRTAAWLGLHLSPSPSIFLQTSRRCHTVDVGRLRSRCSVLWGSRYNAERSYWVRWLSLFSLLPNLNADTSMVPQAMYSGISSSIYTLRNSHSTSRVLRGRIQNAFEIELGYGRCRRWVECGVHGNMLSRRIQSRR